MRQQPQRDNYSEIYKAQSRYVQDLKRQERLEIEKNRKRRENEERRKLLSSIQTKLDNITIINPEVFIGGLFPRRRLSAVVAESGAGKTRFLQKLASDLSIGGSIFDGFAVEEKPLNSLIFAGEAGPELMLRRAYDTQCNIDKEKITVVGMIDAEHRDISLMLDDDRGRQNIEAFIEMNRPDIVFFDTLASFHNKNENKATDMKPILRYLLNLAEKWNMAVVLMHHTRKRPASDKKRKITQDDAIGSSIFNRLVSLIVAIEPFTSSSINGVVEDNKIMLVRSLKTWFQEFSPFTYMILDNENVVHMEINLNPDLHIECNSVDEGQKDKVTLQSVLLKYIDENYSNDDWFKSSDIPENITISNTINDTANFKELENEAGEVTISSRQVRRILTELVDKQILKRAGYNKNTLYQKI